MSLVIDSSPESTITTTPESHIKCDKCHQEFHADNKLVRQIKLMKHRVFPKECELRQQQQKSTSEPASAPVTPTSQHQDDQQEMEALRASVARLQDELKERECELEKNQRQRMEL